MSRRCTIETDGIVEDVIDLRSMSDDRLVDVRISGTVGNAEGVLLITIGGHFWRVTAAEAACLRNALVARVTYEPAADDEAAPADDQS